MHKPVALMGLVLVAMAGFATGDERDGHWSEGMHFPPQSTGMAGGQDRREIPYADRGLRPNPWLGGAHREWQTYPPPPTQEALGYPREDYSPYQRPAPPARRYEYLDERPGAYPPLEGGYSVPVRPQYPRARHYDQDTAYYGSGNVQYAPAQVGAHEASALMGSPGGGLYPPYLAPTTPYAGAAAPYLSPTAPVVAPSPYLNQFGLGASSLLGHMPLSVTGSPLW